MIKQQPVLEIELNNRRYQLMFDAQSTLGECFDALTQMRHYIVERIKSVEDQERLEGERLRVGENPNVTN